MYIACIFYSQIVIERARTERHLPLLDKTKFLVPEELTMSQLTAIIRFIVLAQFYDRECKKNWLWQRKI